MSDQQTPPASMLDVNVVLMEAQALSDFYQRRALSLAHLAHEQAATIQQLTAENDTLKAQLGQLGQPGDGVTDEPEVQP